MIPKIVHYCWFGGNPLPEESRHYLETWKKYLPDYEIKEWNETNVDLNANAYIREAYESKKWAFVTDYVRLYTLYHEGGIYLDTDVELLRSLDPFLHEKGFAGFERIEVVQTGLMASEKGHPFVKLLMEEYDQIHFLKEDGSMDRTTNVTRVTAAAQRLGLKLNNQKQTVCDFTFYPTEYFCPKNCRTMEMHLTENTCAIHYFHGAWDQDRKHFRRFLKKHVPPCVLRWIVKLMDLLRIK